jgi:glycosyltransferase involved in cell wall biosynthesis
MPTQNPPQRHAVPGYLFVLGWYPKNKIGGVNHVLLQLIEQMNHDGEYRPFLLVPNEPRNPPPLPGCPVFSMRVRPPYDPEHPLRSVVAFLATLPWSLLRLRALLNRHNVRVINAHFPADDALTYVLLKRLRLFSGRVVLSLHGNDIKTALDQNGFVRAMYRWLFRSADSITTCSRGLREDLLRLEPRCEKNSLVIHNGIDLEAFRKLGSAGFHLPEAIRGRQFLLNIGKYEHKKGQDILLRAFERIALRFPDLLLVIIGQTGPEIEDIRRLVRASPFAARIVMLQDVPHDHIAAFLETCSVFALPSRREPLGIVILEAAAFERPVVAAASGGVPELIEDRVTGRLVPVEDDGALAEAITEFLTEDGLRQTTARNLRRLVAEQFSWANAYQAYLRVLGESNL